MIAKVEAAETGRKNALGRLRELRDKAPIKTGAQGALALGASFVAGATDAALATRGIVLPMGVKPSQVTGFAAAAAAVIGVITGTPMLTEWATPIAVGHLGPHFYSYGASSLIQIQAATAGGVA